MRQFLRKFFPRPTGGGATFLRSAYVGVRVMEAGNNYTRADSTLQTPQDQSVNDWSWGYEDDQTFWHAVLNDPEAAWGQTFQFSEKTLSEWVPRVPGLYWRPGAEPMRRLSPAAIEFEGEDHWMRYRPWGKSQKVALGGVGTLRLPPAPNGVRLATLTSSLNASAGVPVLLASETWEKICERMPRGGEGKVMVGSAKWQPMLGSEPWSTYFPSTRGVPRGALLLDNPDAINVLDITTPTQIHPFTIMEYRAGRKVLFDFVYATGDTIRPDYRRWLESFFSDYKSQEDRDGHYLLAGDMQNPLWDAEFNSPAELRRNDPAGRSQLALLEARVREHMIGDSITEELLQCLAATSTDDSDVKRISNDIGIDPSSWYGRGSINELCNKLMAEVLRQKKLDALIEVLAPRCRSELLNEEA